MSKALIAALRKLRSITGRFVASSVSMNDQKRALNEFARRTAMYSGDRCRPGTVYRQIVDEKALETHWRQLSPKEKEELPDTPASTP